MVGVLTVIVAFAVQSVGEVRDPRPQRVTDAAHVMAADVESRVDGIALGIAKAEVVVVTLDDVPGTPKQFATELFNTWRLGSAERNDGVLVLLVTKQRRLEIETGAGIEAALPAWWLSEMQAQAMVPAFKRGAYGDGIEAGMKAIAGRLGNLPGEGERDSAPGEYRSDGTVTDSGSSSGTTTTSHTQRSYDEPPPDRTGLVAGGAAAGGGGLLGGALMWRRRKKQRTCEACQQRMHPLDEIADDAHLDRGQQTEEKLGSVDYEVLICHGCQASRTLRHNKWFSGRSTCPGCAYKTMRSTSKTLVHATYDYGGTVQVDESCAHCPRTRTYTRSTPARTRPSTTSSSSSSSSSSGRSSFSSSSSSSGGRSRGGGAGSSW